jgi:macrolide transport system ATP-binding/permease protein
LGADNRDSSAVSGSIGGSDVKHVRVWLMRLAGLWRNDQLEREVDAEIAANLQLHIDDNLRAGMTPEKARREALLKLGGVESTKQLYRERGSVPFLWNMGQDVRFALRQLRKNPGFALTAVVMLALGMCASVAIFAFVDATLIKPLPYRDPNRLLGVFEKVPLFPQSNLSFPDYLDWKKLNTVFSSLDVYQQGGFIVSTASGAQPSTGVRVTDGFFRTLGVVPALGRDFRTGEDLRDAPATVILSYGTWQRRYGGKRDVLGQAVALDGVPHTIIGVLPADFHFAPSEPAEFWVAFQPESNCDLRRSCHGIYGIGRLKDGVTTEAALANLTSIANQLEKQYPDSNSGQGATVAPLAEVITGQLRPILLVLLSGTGLLLLIAGVNAASLLLVRSESRMREIAVRSALGAGRGRLCSQFITEGLVLVAGGSLLGLASAYWLMKLLLGLIASEYLAHVPYLQGLGLNGRVLAFAGGIALLAAVVFSLTPTLHFALPRFGPGIRDKLSEGSRGSSANTWRRLGSKLVVVELATAVVLLAGAGLLGKSLYLLLNVEIGMRPDHLATLEVAIPRSRYPKDEQLLSLEREIISRVERLPGVRSVGIGSQLPVSYNGNTDWIRFVGRPYNGIHNEVNERDVSAEFFKTLQVKLLRGRYFSDAEDASKPRVVIINQSLAKKYFPGQDPIGKQIGDTDLTPKSIRQVVGVIEDVREGSLDSEIWPAEYEPFNQSPGHYFTVVVRTSQGERTLIPILTATIHQLEPEIVAIKGTSMQDAIHDSLSAYMHRTAAWLVGGFAFLALLLGVVGLYGVVAYSVSQRTREIGVRMALGAEPRSIYDLVLREAGWLALTGIMIGLACAVGAASLMKGLLFGVHSWDVPTLSAVSVVLGLAALLASFIPARRAAGVNPIEALRAE